MKTARISALDGLKGMAIIAVIFTHLPVSIWYQSVPSLLHPLLTILLGSGGVAVTIFFIITGYLMGRLYPDPGRPIAFWSRRYARLFPPFLVMVASFTLLRLLPPLSPLLQLALVFTCAIAMRILLAIFSSLQRYLPHFGFILICSALLLQAGTALWYSEYLLRVPPAVYYQLWSPLTQTIITALVNATLTLPLGQYIPQLDGIYWALAAEVLFYLLYPLFFAPLINQKYSRYQTMSLLLALFPFSFGLYLIGQRVLGLETLKLHLFIYFAAGVLLSRYPNWQSCLMQRFSFLRSARLFFLLIIIIFGSIFLNTPLSKTMQPWVGISTVIPVSLLVMVTISPNTFSNRLFSTPILTFLGTYSYGLFLTHSFVIHLLESFIKPDTANTAILMTVITFAGSLLLSWILYQLTEKPYFLAPRKNTQAQSPLRLPHNTSVITAICLGGIIFILLYSSFKPPVSLFTVVTRHGTPSWSGIFSEQGIPIQTQPIQQSFIATDDKLGMSLAHIRNRSIEGGVGGFVPSKLIVHLRNDQGKILAEGTYNAYEIIDSRYHPFGFPLQATSKGKHYSIEYQLSQASATRQTELVSTEQAFLSVYFIDKQQLLHQPTLLFAWSLRKITEPFSNPAYWVTFFLLTPFLGIMMIATVLNRRKQTED